MSANCGFCDDTGSLSKDLAGQLDCAHCSVAMQRVWLENWAFSEKLGVRPEALWIIYNKGVADGKAGKA